MKIKRLLRVTMLASLIPILLTTQSVRAQTVQNEEVKCLNKKQQTALANREIDCTVKALDLKDTKSALQTCLDTNCGKEWYESKEAVICAGVGGVIVGWLIKSIVEAQQNR